MQASEEMGGMDLAPLRIAVGTFLRSLYPNTAVEYSVSASSLGGQCVDVSIRVPAAKLDFIDTIPFVAEPSFFITDVTTSVRKAIARMNKKVMMVYVDELGKLLLKHFGNPLRPSGVVVRAVEYPHHCTTPTVQVDAFKPGGKLDYSNTFTVNTPVSAVAEIAIREIEARLDQTKGPGDEKAPPGVEAELNRVARNRYGSKVGVIKLTYEPALHSIFVEGIGFYKSPLPFSVQFRVPMTDSVDELSSVVFNQIDIIMDKKK